MGGLERAPHAPLTLGSAPAEPWRSSTPHTPLTLGSAPAEPWRCAIQEFR